MEPNVKNLLALAINAMIDLAEASGMEVRMTFQCVAMVIKPGRSAAELMEEFERNERLATLADALAPFLMGMFDVPDFYNFCRHRLSSSDIADEFPLPLSGSPRSLFLECSLLLCTRGVVRETAFWDGLERERSSPRAVGEIRKMRQLFIAELAEN